MSFSDLYSHFSKSSVLPISVDDIRNWIEKTQYCDEIELHLADIDPTILRGEICTFRRQDAPYQTAKDVARIVIAKNQSLCWQRLVYCKEMIHLCDKDYFRTNKESIEKLAENLLFPGGWETAGDEKIESTKDMLTIYQAVMLLAPEDTVDHFRPKFISGELSRLELANIYRIPEYYIDLLFAPEFGSMRDRLKDL